jgi:hypothetical protein
MLLYFALSLQQSVDNRAILIQTPAKISKTLEATKGCALNAKSQWLMHTKAEKLGVPIMWYRPNVCS